MKNKPTVILTLTLLCLIIIQTVNAEIPMVANVTFYAIGLCEQPYDDYTPPYETIKITESPCESKKIDETKVNESLHRWLSNSIENESLISDNAIISPCDRYEFKIKIKNHDVNIYYDGTWLIFTKEINTDWMNATEFDEKRTSFDDEIYEIAEITSNIGDLKCKSLHKLKITTITYIADYTPDNLFDKDYAGDYNDLKTICRCHQGCEILQDNVIYERIPAFSSPRIDHFSEDICFSNPIEKKAFVKNLFRTLDWLRESDRIYEQGSGSDKWYFINNLEGDKSTFDYAYRKALDNKTIGGFENFINIEAKNFRYKLDDSSQKLDEKKLFAEYIYMNIINRTTSITQSWAITYPLLLRYYNAIKDYNYQADIDIARAETDYARKYDDIYTKYLLARLSEQSKTLKEQINTSERQFTQQINETRLHFVITTILLFMSLLIPIGAVIVEHIGHNARIDFFRKVTEQIINGIRSNSILLKINSIFFKIGLVLIISPIPLLLWTLLILIISLIPLSIRAFLNLESFVGFVGLSLIYLTLIIFYITRVVIKTGRIVIKTKLESVAYSILFLFMLLYSVVNPWEISAYNALEGIMLVVIVLSFNLLYNLKRGVTILEALKPLQNSLDERQKFELKSKEDRDNLLNEIKAKLEVIESDMQDLLSEHMEEIKNIVKPQDKKT